MHRSSPQQEFTCVTSQRVRLSKPLRELNAQALHNEPRPQSDQVLKGKI